LNATLPRRPRRLASRVRLPRQHAISPAPPAAAASNSCEPQCSSLSKPLPPRKTPPRARSAPPLPACDHARRNLFEPRFKQKIGPSLSAFPAFFAVAAAYAFAKLPPCCECAPITAPAPSRGWLPAHPSRFEQVRALQGTAHTLPESGTGRSATRTSSFRRRGRSIVQPAVVNLVVPLPRRFLRFERSG